MISMKTNHTDKEAFPGIILTPQKCLIADTPTTRLLIIADLHLCLEREATTGGVLLLPSPARDIKQAIEHARKKHGPDTLVIAGDIKHDFGRGGYDCHAEVLDLLEWARKKFKKVVLVRGNHDNYTMGIAHRTGTIYEQDHYQIHNLRIHHGHKPIKPEPGTTIIMGHEHPAIELRDTIGTRERLPCYLHAQRKKYNLIILPAISPLAPGTDMITTPQKELLSPLLRDTGTDDLKPTAIHDNQLLEFPEVGKMRKVVGW